MSIKIIAQNKKARFEYFIEDTFEAGLVLAGTEVKSLRDGKVNLKEAYGKIEKGEVFIHGMNISPYTYANRSNHDPIRVRKLLLHSREISKLIGQTQEKGLTLVPLKIYFKDGRCKLELALAKGKKLFDKRETLKKKDADREMERSRKFRD